MNTKDIDFAKVSIPADEFDALMRRALDAPVPAPEVKKDPAQPQKSETRTQRSTKRSSSQ